MMRSVHWLFLVSVALFVAGIGFVIAGARSRQQAPPVPETPVTVPVATVKQIMNGIVVPSATSVYGAVATIYTEQGVEDRRPETDAQWEAVGASAAALVESGNLLMIGNRAIDNGEWMTMSQALVDSAKVVLAATQAKDVDALLSAGEGLNESCDVCHMKYQQ